MKMCYCETCKGEVPARGEVLFPEGTRVKSKKTGELFIVTMIRHGYTWMSNGATIQVGRMARYFDYADNIVPGDTVEFHVAHSYCTVPGRGKVLAIHEDRAWVLFPGRSVPISPLLTSIKRVS